MLIFPDKALHGLALTRITARPQSNSRLCRTHMLPQTTTLVSDRWTSVTLRTPSGKYRLELCHGSSHSVLQQKMLHVGL